MKKYEVPVMKLHQLKCGSMVMNSAKPFEDNSSMKTERYSEDDSFDSGNLYD